MLLSLVFIKQRYSPGQYTYAVYAMETESVLGWVDIDWDDTWHVARNFGQAA